MAVGHRKVSELRRQTIGRKADVVKRVMSGPDGKELLQVLEGRFPGDFHTDPYMHAFRAGERSVVEYLKALLNYTPEEGHDVPEIPIDGGG